MASIAADPYAWPHDGLDRRGTGLLVVDMQVDFLQPGGYLEAFGYDLAGTRAAIPGAQRLLAAARRLGLTVIHTRQGYRPDLADLPPYKKWRSARGGGGIGVAGPNGRFLVRGEPGHAIIPEVAPLAGEIVVDKSAIGAFCGTDMDMVLKLAGLRHLVVCGITTDVCVFSTLREANDRGFECLLAADACGSGDPAAHAATLHMITVEGGVFGAVADVAAIEAGLALLEAKAA
ncbi:cysteine hydrolase family protein [Zavarzinia sp. CC-PAN008]|uniref:cysteine hydrolase family protein n=1 Tax=Zavarzinia sp. CC-PAN008 TaxID=3243332 RepID=UPI003F747E49